MMPTSVHSTPFMDPIVSSERGCTSLSCKRSVSPRKPFENSCNILNSKKRSLSVCFSSSDKTESTINEKEQVHCKSSSSFCSSSHQYDPKDLTLLKVIGRGTFAQQVALARHEKTNDICVVKSLEKSILIKRKQVKHTLTEKKVLQQFKGHPFIVQMYTCFQTKTKLNFVLEYCQGGELFYQLQKQKNQKFNEEKVVFYAAEVLVALASLHAKGIIYRDLKPENVLLDTKGHIKLADFGFAKEKMFFPQKTFSFCGSPEYLSPEMIKRKGHGMETDMWSFGCFCYELLTGNPPFQNENMYRLFTAIEQGHVWYPPDLSGIVISLLKNLLVVNPNQRLTAEEAMKHDFFQQIDWEQLYAKKLVPPIQPNVSSHECTQNFDDGFTLEPVAPLDYCSIIKFQQKENNNYSNNINRNNNDNDCKRWKTNRNSSSSSNSDINRNSNSKSNNSSMDTNDNYLEDLFDEF